MSKLRSYSASNANVTSKSNSLEHGHFVVSFSLLYQEDFFLVFFLLHLSQFSLVLGFGSIVVVLS